MKIVKRDEHKAQQEANEKAKKAAEQEKRDKYIESLKNNRNFQKYVVEGIIKKNLEALTDIRKINAKETDDMQEIGWLVIQAKAARAQLERILGELIN